MATVSFDTVFELQEPYVESFFEALEDSKHQQPPPPSPYVNEEERKRGVELLKKYCSR